MRAEGAAVRPLGQCARPGAEGLHRGLPVEAWAGVSGAGGGLGAAWAVVQGLAQGRGLPPSLATPHSLQVAPASGQAGDGELARRGLLASCLLSRGLIYKTGRLVLTEAAGGTADVSARLSSWGPGSCAQAAGGFSPTLPSSANAPTPAHSPSAVPPAANQALRRGHLGPPCQLRGGGSRRRGAGRKVEGLRGHRLRRACLPVSFCK